MITISVCMIVKNEEEVLERALKSVKGIADELIIVDTGSTDQTKKVASKYTDKIYDFAWCDDFAKARNYSFSKASMDYCMWLDADDIIYEEDREDLINLKKTLNPDTSVVMLKYNAEFDHNNKPTFTYYRERLLRRKDGFQWQGFIHEVISPRGKILYSDIAITHSKVKSGDSNRNLRIFREKLNEGVVFSPREIFYYARELFYHQLYEEAITEFKRFLNTRRGWKENNISACQFLGYCFHNLDDIHEAISWLLDSLCYDIPRAEICCDLAKYFFELKQYEQSIYWSAVALSCERDDTSGAFISPDCYDYIPYMQLCLCYDRLKDYENAEHYNELAGKCKPNDSSYQHNKSYFNKISKNSLKK